MKVLNLKFKTSLRDLDLDYYSIIAVFRIAVVAIAFIDFSSVLLDINTLLSSNAIIPVELGLLESEYYSILNPLYQLLLYNDVSITSFINVLSIVYILSLILCGTGFHTKKSFIVAIVLQLLIYRTISNFNYGYDNFITMSFFYCLIFPVNRKFSLDRWRFSKKDKYYKAPSKYYSLTKFLQTHLSIIYFVSGIAKSVDINWWNGNAIWRSMATLSDFIYIKPIFLLIISSLTVLSELAYPLVLVIQSKKIRKLMVTNIILMHLGIGVFLGLSSFASIMIVWNIIAFHKEFLTDE